MPGPKNPSSQRGVILPLLLLLVAIGALSLLFASRKLLFKNFHSSRTVEAVSYFPRVLLVIYNPVLESQGGQKLTTYKGWQDPDSLTTSHMNEMKTVSGGLANYSVAERVELDEFPVLEDSFQYTDETYLQCVSSGGSNCHNPNMADYLKILEKVDACGKRNRGEIDEVWMWGGPWFGFWESNLTGPGAYFYNSSPTEGSPCEKLLPVMGYSYERGLNEMFENFGHRVESAMKQVYGSWEAKFTHNWNKFALLDADVPGKGGCGNAHLAVNAPTNTGYNTTDTRTVASDCDDFLDYPNINGEFKQISCSEWGCNPTGYYRWWYSHIPKNDGNGPDGTYNSWWTYLLDPQKANEHPKGVFSDTSATLEANSATFNFNYSIPASSYKIDLSTYADMSWGVYLDFGTGTNSPVTVTNPTKWDAYKCGTTLYWRVYDQDRSVSSGINTVTVCPLPPTPTNTPTPTLSPTPSPSPTPTYTPTPTPDSSPPSISFTNPTDGSIVKKNATTTISVNATDASGVSKVEFYVANSLLCTDNSSPYACSWKVPARANTSYALQAKAFDNKGNNTSKSITVKSSK
ncbi:MAG: Ig-like domain-containing protein [bacterium]|nr:Ig-like domain-containing protein [bacterium]